MHPHPAHFAAPDLAAPDASRLTGWAAGDVPGMSFPVRALRAQDLPAVHVVQAMCYPAGYQEPVEAFAVKLAASPETAWGVDHPGQPGVLMAYLFCLPIQGFQWPALHALHCTAAADADGLYLHDLSLHPDARGQGLGQALVHQARQWALARGLAHMRLIAVQGSQLYWAKQGFERVPDRVLQAHAADLNTFGAQACAMARPLRR